MVQEVNAGLGVMAVLVGVTPGLDVVLKENVMKVLSANYLEYVVMIGDRKIFYL